MTRQAPHLVPLAALVAALVVSCTFGEFDDFESKAPAVKIEGDSTHFGKEIAPVFREQAGKQTDGALLFLAGNDPVAVNTVTFSPNGGFSNGGASADDYNDLFSPKLIGSLAGMASELPDGPWALMGLPEINAVTRVDIIPVDSAKVCFVSEQQYPDLKRIGVGVATANLEGSDERDDVAAGAEGHVVLCRTSTWPRYTHESKNLVIGPGQTPDWPATAEFNVIAAGDLGGTARDEVAVAAGSFVAVIHRISEDVDCTADCFEVLEIPRPEGAQSFGSALLVADVDNDDKSELVVGASGGSGAVFVYKLTDENFDGTSAPAPSDKLSPPSGAGSFGASLASGRIDTKQPLLAVGAPSSAVGGVSGAGKVYLYDTSLELVSDVELARAEQDGALGTALAVMPFAKEGSAYEILVAGAKQAVYVFFAFTTDDHDDIRR